MNNRTYLTRLLSCLLLIGVMSIFTGCLNSYAEEEETVPDVLGTVGGETTKAESNATIEAPQEPLIQLSVIKDIAEYPDGRFSIKHKEDDGSYSYTFPNYTRGLKDNPASASGANPKRYMIVHDIQEEGRIPVMFWDDVFIFRSKNGIPDKYVIERFKDDGYTLGISGLTTNGKSPYYQCSKASFNDFSDTMDLLKLGASEIYILSVGERPLTDEYISPAGTVLGLVKDARYECDIRTGTEKKNAVFTADVHLYTCYERFLSNDFRFTEDGEIAVGFPEQLPSGYYNINNQGLFRYISKDDCDKALSEIDYNTPYLILDEKGNIISTMDHWAIKNGYITDIKLEEKER